MLMYILTLRNTGTASINTISDALLRISIQSKLLSYLFKFRDNLGFLTSFHANTRVINRHRQVKNQLNL